MHEFPDAAAWEAWLADQHATSTEAWLRIGKKGKGLPLIAIADALDVALCYGWIDGQRRSLDEVSFLQRYCPRRPRSSWSQVNVAKVAALTAAGRMRPPGIAEVEKAKADGRWEAAYESQRTAEIPPDLAAALAGDPVAAAAFARLSRSDRYWIILQLLKTRTPEGRAKNVARTVERLKG
ncbi:YdeI/OmpD-associated family protein [Phytohabitans sp. LJ34]|uniref:YdeI/OmpD-associated family protein n=1 Tax=Phytohabitans sp. LJ34 TaxID=3452217 RepID=UPI003F8C35FA